MVKVIEISDFVYDEKNTYGITWELTRNCVFMCRYCVVCGHEPIYYPQRIINFIKLVNKKRNVTLTLFGGEPTDHPDFLKILKELKDINIQVYTNLNKDISFYDEMLRIKPDIGLETSYHPDRANFNQYYTKLQYLSKKVKNITSYVMWDTKYKDYPSKYEAISSLGIVSMILRVQHFDQSPLTPEEEKWYEGKQVDAETLPREQKVKLTLEDKEGLRTLVTNLNYLRDNNLTHFKFFQCSCGKKNIYISSMGDVYPCLDYRLQNMKPLQSLHNKDISEELVDNIITKPIICMVNNCTSELSVPKKRLLSYTENN